MIVVYSDEVPELDDFLRNRLGQKHRITVIPPSPTEMGAAKHATEHFRHVGLRARTQNTRFYRDPHRLHNIIMNSDAVYLIGGNTFDFLDYAHHIGLFELLDEFEQAGGIIIGDSAGSIILSPNIATALIPTTCPDDHTVDMESYLGMGRIPFHISPHFDPSAEVAQHELDELQTLANVSNRAVMVLQDGEGFIMEGNDIVQTTGKPKRLEPDASIPAVVNAVEILPIWASIVE